MIQDRDPGDEANEGTLLASPAFLSHAFRARLPIRLLPPLRFTVTKELLRKVQPDRGAFRRLWEGLS